MARGRVFTRGAPLVQSRKRKTLWIDSGAPNDTGYRTIAANTVIFDSQLATIPEPVTIVRTHGVSQVSPTSVTAERAMWGAIGMIVVKESAAAIGITALPDPLADPQEDWYFYSFFNSSTQTAITDGVAWEYTNVQDSKAMRKLELAETSVVIIANGSGTSIDINFMFRQLLKIY